MLTILISWQFVYWPEGGVPARIYRNCITCCEERCCSVLCVAFELKGIRQRNASRTGLEYNVHPRPNNSAMDFKNRRLKTTTSDGEAQTRSSKKSCSVRWKNVDETTDEDKA
jgi:hypothetical protein